ncbi:DUF2622 domain-containing protein [Klebsiella quasipneumoniae]|uniref:DUF2622 domain-containing protein n=1 Tax=Klebsiella quasipneumoniae TaxID=1463165 RepID=UPI0015E4C8AC|nr:DUF2622 domain-containing protein [Klebsiella quasipneumoniae]QLP58464.1 DUF2622 domain-containing protein [Klebsiella quasipneumoniae]
MAKFTVRVELHDSEDADYDALHKKMEAEDFSREITSSSGNTYDLPSAEYIYESETKTTEDVGRLAKQIASKIKARPRILVTKSDGRWVSGLDGA